MGKLYYHHTTFTIILTYLITELPSNNSNVANKVKLINNTKQMKSITTEQAIIIIVIATVIIGLLNLSYSYGYHKRANDINVRIINTPNNQEECFTREEIDFFIYGE